MQQVNQQQRQQEVRENVRSILQQVRQTALEAGRDPRQVQVMAVTKTVAPELVNAAIAEGITLLGENKAQELCEKYENISKPVHWHMIGHLQKNKVRQVIDKAVLIHSVDTVGLAEQIEKEAVKRDLDVSILLEVNVAGEESKFGFAPEEVEEAAREIAKYPHVHIQGLMTIAPFVENSEENRGVFKKLYELYVDMKRKNIDNVTMNVLSMGMTGDYQTAIEEGATMVRVGTGIFGTRAKIGEK